MGFKGSGFSFKMDSDDFIFIIGIQPSQYGGQCCVEFGIQPKMVDTNGFNTVDFKKIKYYNCELRTRLTPSGQGDNWWKYSDDETDNLKLANQIADLVKDRALPIINSFKSNPNILESINSTDLDNNFYKSMANKIGMSLMTTDIRFAWVLTKVFEKTNIQKAKEFALYGINKLDTSNKFFGRRDFERVLAD